MSVSITSPASTGTSFPPVFRNPGLAAEHQCKRRAERTRVHGFTGSRVHRFRSGFTGSQVAPGPVNHGTCEPGTRELCTRVRGVLQSAVSSRLQHHPSRNDRRRPEGPRIRPCCRRRAQFRAHDDRSRPPRGAHAGHRSGRCARSAGRHVGDRQLPGVQPRVPVAGARGSRDAPGACSASRAARSNRCACWRWRTTSSRWKPARRPCAGRRASCRV